MKTKTNNEAVNETITFFDKKVNNVIDVLYNYSLLNNHPECIKLDQNTQKQIIEDTINYYLTKIESLNMDDIEKKYYDIQEVTDYFSYSFNKKLKEKDRYQTVYAKYEGSAAAPTAGLHFTNELLEEIRQKGIDIANVTLHVGIGTFRPVKEENVEEHAMHTEHFYIKQEDVEKINKAKKEGHRIIAVGTTSCRVLESIADENGYVKPIEADTGIFIYPGYKFKCIDGLITNFHLPESTLIMLVSALAGKDYIMHAYEEAVKEKYRFFSFGDAMAIL